MSDFRDFIPEGQDHSNGKSVFQDFIPAPKLEKIEPVIKPDVELKQEDIDALKEMEEETIENNGGVSVEPEQPSETVEPKKTSKRSNKKK